jgi:hypothetical protein
MGEREAEICGFGQREWQALLNREMKMCFPWNGWDFLASLRVLLFSKRTSLHAAIELFL